MHRRIVALTLAVATAGCSPFLYMILQLRGHASHGSVVLGQPVTGSTTAAGDSYAPSCIHPDARDEAWTFVPPASGRYRFDVHAEYDSVVAVYSTSGQELGCNDDYGSTRESRLDLAMTQGQAVTVVVDGYHGATGNYSLRVDPSETPVATPTVAAAPLPPDAPEMAARCEDAPLLTTGLVTGTVLRTVHTAAVSCGSHGPGGDVVYRFDAGTRGVLAVAENSMFDAILELRDGCGPDHRVLACNDDSPDTRHSAITATIGPGRYFLVVDTYSQVGEGPFALLVTWSPTSPQVDAGPANHPVSGVSDVHYVEEIQTVR